MVPLNFLIEARVGESGNILHAVCAHPSCCYSLFPTPDRFSAVYPFLSMAAAAAAYPATMKAMCDVRHATHPFMHSSQVDSTFYASPIHETNADVALSNYTSVLLSKGVSIFSLFSLNLALIFNVRTSIYISLLDPGVFHPFKGSSRIYINNGSYVQHLYVLYATHCFIHSSKVDGTFYASLIHSF